MEKTPKLLLKLTTHFLLQIKERGLSTFVNNPSESKGNYCNHCNIWNYTLPSDSGPQCRRSFIFYFFNVYFDEAVITILSLGFICSFTI